MRQFGRIIFAVLALATFQTAQAKDSAPTVRLEIASRAPAFGGQSFGEHGSYETITGVAHMRIDPTAPSNRGIVDLQLAPREADGMVSYDIDFVIQRPKEPGLARRVMLYEVVNRGMRLMNMMAGGAMNPNDPGTGLLQRQGLTLVWSGWQGDVTNPALIGARFPLAKKGGKPVMGRVSTEAIFENLTSNTITLPYAAAMTDQRDAIRLTVRGVTSDKPTTLPISAWRFVDDRKIEIQRPAGFDAGAIYRFEYIAKDPKVMGLGFAATRDFISFLRYASGKEGNPLGDMTISPRCQRPDRTDCSNPAGGLYSSVIAFGGSQSGRYLRDYLWQGFNRDLTGNRVFDGVIPFIPGARRTFTNFRFAEPGRFSRQHEDHDVPGFTFPYAYSTLRDPVTGVTDGIMKSCTETKTCPKIFHIDTSAEFWQAGAALVGTGGTSRDVAFPTDVRAYMIAGGAHAPGMTMPACRYGPNSFNYSSIVRAMLIRMIDWTTKSTPPPESRWPTLSSSTLVPLSALVPPAAPQIDLVWPKVMNRPIPPAGRGDWPAFVPQIDADGNDKGGIRLPQVAVPEGTYLGWNLRKAGYGEGDLCLLAGSYVPFAADAASRAGDTRASLAELYPATGDRAVRAHAVAEVLRKDGFLLAEDAEKFNGDGR